MFREIPEYSRFSRYAATPGCFMLFAQARSGRKKSNISLNVALDYKIKAATLTPNWQFKWAPAELQNYTTLTQSTMSTMNVDKKKLVYQHMNDLTCIFNYWSCHHCQHRQLPEQYKKCDISNMALSHNWNVKYVVIYEKYKRYKWSNSN